MCIYSYNSRGFDQNKQNFCNMILSESVSGDKIPVLCNQENFVLKGNSYKIRKAFPGFSCLIKPATKGNQDKGRPRNGMFIAFPEMFKSKFEDISPAYWRIQAVRIKSENRVTVIVNSYFPQDPKTQRFDEGELIETLECIQNIIENNQFSHFIWTGDINVDFSRNTGQTNRTNSYIDDNGLKKSWEKFQVDFTCHHEINGVSYVSTIDHFLWNEAMDDIVEEAGVLHMIDNMSDYSPIYCVVELENFNQDNHAMQ